MVLSQFADLRAYPRVRRFVREYLDMQFDDVRGMMKLPRPRQGITGGSLYWGFIQLFRRLCEDQQQMTRAQEQLRQQGWQGDA